MQIFELTVYFLLGLAVGSFSNVCIYRLPIQQSIILPKSHCPSCKTPIPFYYNIPLFSYLYLRGQCVFCQNKITIRYFIVELLTALFFLFFGWKYGLSVNLVYFFILIPVFVIIFFIDLKHLIIPDSLVLLIGILALGKLLLPNLDSIFTSLYPSALGALVAFLFIGGLIVFYQYVRKIEAMGLGDLKLFVVLGFLFGLKGIMFVLIISSLSGAIIGSIILMRKNKNFQSQLPFGPYIILATLLYIVLGPKIIMYIDNVLTNYFLSSLA